MRHIYLAAWHLLFLSYNQASSVPCYDVVAQQRMNDSQVVVAMIPVTHKFSSKTLVDRGPFLSCLFMSSNLQTICVE